MKTIAISTLKPNCFFEKPVFIDKGYIVLLPEVPVSTELIRRLSDWNYTELFSESDQVSATVIGSTAAIPMSMGMLDKTIADNKLDDEVVTFYNGLISYFEGLTRTFYESGEIDIQLVTNKVKAIIEMNKNHKDKLISLIVKKKPYDYYVLSHSINTTILSLAIADVLKFPSHRLIEIGNAASLHEIGMLKLPPKLYQSNIQLSAQDKKSISAHTVLGYKVLKGLSIHEDLAICALEHHEHADGSGYPRGLQNNSISVYSRIISIACSFDGAISLRPYKKALDAHKAMIDLLVTRKKHYDENILKALVVCLSIFPPGIFVQLTNNTRGVVSRINPANPKYPIVKILLNEFGEKLQNPLEVETSAESGISIRHVLTDEEIEKYHINE